MDGWPGLHLWIRVDSPVGADRNVTIWMECGDEPSLAFGTDGWHVHEDYVRCVSPGVYREESLLDLLDAIRGDQFVVLEELDGEHAPFADVLDLREPNALLERLTAPGCSHRIRIKTFTGRGDREVSLDDLIV